MTAPVRRSDFPILSRRIDGRRLVYLDSAATALKPKAVLAAERDYYTRIGANVGRGRHALGEEASEALEFARKRVARFIGGEPPGVVFVRNTTEAINVVSEGLDLQPDDVVLLASADEHHANVVPWLRRARVVTVRNRDWPGQPCDLEQLEAAIARHRPRVVAVGHASNVTGLIQPAGAICAAARRAGAISIVDAAQSVPHLPVDMRTMGCDFLAFSGHKVMSPTGIGVLYGRPDSLAALRPLIAGGGAVDRVTLDGFTLKRPPYAFEAGTPHIAGAIGLAAALDYVERIGFDALRAHETLLAARLERVLRDIPRTRLLMADGSSERLAIGTLVLDAGSTHPDVVAQALSDGQAIMVRSGFQCAHPLFDRIGAASGGLRASAYGYTTARDIDTFGAAVRDIVGRLLGG